MRYEDWPRRLDSYIKAASGRPFSWGQHDCCTFVCRWILEATGQDIFTGEFEGRYDSEASAVDILKPFGGAEGVARHFLGEPLPEVLRAQRGDVALFDQPIGSALAVVIGDRAAAPRKGAGLRFVPLRSARLAWRV